MVNGSLKMLEIRAERVSVRDAACLIAVGRVAHACPKSGWV
jgi:hypothetical protein